MSLLLDKPVIAISFHHKCSSLMSEMGLSEYCHDINQMNADTLIEQFQALVRNADDVKQVILQRVETSRRALDEQYEFLFGDFIDQIRSVRRSERPRRDGHRLPIARHASASAGAERPFSDEASRRRSSR